MKWVTLLKDIKEKVGFAQSPTSTASSSSPSSAGHYDPNVPPLRHDFAPSPARSALSVSDD